MGLAVESARRRFDDVDLQRDRALVERCQAGDRQAFEDLYLRYRERLYRFCLRRLRNPEEAEDAAQEAFARAWRALPSFGEDRRFYPWLSVIASNLCVDTQRRRSRSTPLPEEELADLLPPLPPEQDRLAERLDGALLGRALERLSPRHQKVLELREARNWTYQQIAEFEGVEVSAIETLLFRARRSLRREFFALADTETALAALVGLRLKDVLGRLGFGRLASTRSSVAALARRARSTRLPVGVISQPAIPALGGVAAAMTAAALLVPGGLSSTPAAARQPATSSAPAGTGARAPGTGPHGNPWTSAASGMSASKVSASGARSPASAQARRSGVARTPGVTPGALGTSPDPSGLTNELRSLAGGAADLAQLASGISSTVTSTVQSAAGALGTTTSSLPVVGGTVSTVGTILGGPPPAGTTPTTTPTTTTTTTTTTTPNPLGGLLG